MATSWICASLLHSPMAKTWIFVVFCTIAVTGAAVTTPLLRTTNDDNQVLYDNYKLLRVHSASRPQLQLVSDLVRDTQDLDVWATHNNSLLDVLSAPSALQAVQHFLNTNNIPYEILIEDLQEEIRKANPLQDTLENRSGHRLTWNRYHLYKDIESYLDYLANTYPELCQVQVIGHTSEGREIKLLKVSTGGAPKPAIWIDGGIHAREWISPATVSYLLLQLVEFREEHQSLLDSFDWYVLPVANPDGYEYSHSNDRLWRKTRSKNPKAGKCVGVDANRNFDFHWLEVGSSEDTCQDIYAGPKAFSEPETRAMADFITAHRASIKVYLTFHSYSQLWLVPWGYKGEKPEDYYDLYVLAEKAVQALEKTRGTDYLLGTAEELVYTSSGGSDDWAKGVAGIKYAYTVELPDTGHHGFVLPASRIVPIGQETWEGVKALAKHYIEVIAPTEG